MGAGSYADRANTVSVGASSKWTDAWGYDHEAVTRQITNVAAGTEGTDAVNKNQLDEVASQIGGINKYFKASGDDGLFDDALLDGAHTTAAGAGSVAGADGASALGYRAVAAGVSSAAVGNNATAGNDYAVAVGADTQRRCSCWRQVLYSRRRTQLRQGCRGYRFRQRCSCDMAGAIAAAPGTDNRISAAAGTYGGENALSVGFSRRLPGNGALLIGGSVAGGGESSGTVGVSFGW